MPALASSSRNLSSAVLFQRQLKDEVNCPDTPSWRSIVQVPKPSTIAASMPIQRTRQEHQGLIASQPTHAVNTVGSANRPSTSDRVSGSLSKNRNATPPATRKT